MPHISRKRTLTTTSVLILGSTARMSYGTMQSWLTEHASGYHVDVLDLTHAGVLTQILAPRSIHVPPWVTNRLPLWCNFLSAIGRYDTILVLCVSDDQVAGGHAPFRLLGELLFSRSLVLIGPHLAKTWPGGREALRSQRVREVAVIVTAGVLSVVTTVITLAAIVLYDALHPPKARQ